jgi:NAD-dependent dihydropyrimidine dehydrogenase PreA subunit
MISIAKPSLHVIVYEGDGSRPLEDRPRCELVQALLEKDCSIASVRQRGQSAQQRVSLSGLQTGVTLVLGRFEQSQPEQAEDAQSGGQVRFLGIEGLATAAVVELVEAVRREVCGEPAKFWKPWFPVIDFNRCTNCMQCLSFCLFDVYGVTTEGKIKVQNQTNCKTDCPACSRVCPEVAILFPKYKAGPINGDEIDSEDLRREGMKVDISALLGGDIYAALRDRSAKAKSRFSKERDEDRALKERLRCLAKLQEQMDIPPEVLAALPSIDEIRARSEQAKARAQAALENTPQTREEPEAATGTADHRPSPLAPRP